MPDPRTTENGHVTCTRDRDCDLRWFVETFVDNPLRMDLYSADAERTGDDELAELFRREQSTSRKDAEEGNAPLGLRLRG